MSLQDRLKPVIKVLKLASLWGGSGLFVAYHIRQTYRSMNSIVNTNVLDREKKCAAEYIYIDDPSYGTTLKIEQDRESRQSVGLARIWKSLKYSLAWRMLWLCRHGNKEQRNIALEQLAAFKNNKHWDCLKLAQALDKNTAVLLAWTRGADLRYFLPPPIHVRRAALSSELLSFKLRDMIIAVQNINPHSCIKQFLSKHFANVHDQAVEFESPSKPDSISEKDLCLLCIEVLHHHLTLFHNKNYEEDQSAKTLISIGLLPKIAELLLRNPNDVDVDLAVLRILSDLSIHPVLLTDFFQNGLIRELSRLVRSNDIRLASSAAVCLANLSGEYCYRPGLFLLYPIYRTTTPHSCDTLLVHGLRGGVFVTWRQRDRNCGDPIGIIDVTISQIDSETCAQVTEDTTKYMDPEFKQVVDDLKELEEESLLADLEVVLHDIPIEAKRETKHTDYYTTKSKHIALNEENQDKCDYTYCWPKDWLPKDCDNLRILGVNYWSSLTDWLERCPLQSADIKNRATELGPMLIDAEVGKKNVPVVWLAHSMGGLIVKQVLVEASKSEDLLHKSLSQNTKAVVFFSTPHKGSALATMPRAAAAVLWPSNDVRQLKENSPVLLELHKAFIKFADVFGWETISFAETLPTLVTAFKVPIHFVESVSADLGRGVFYQLPLDHLCICKPATRQSIIYTTVLDILQRATNNNAEFKYSNPFIKWIMSLLIPKQQNKPKQVIENIDNTKTKDGSLVWFEATFIDGFTE